MSCLGTLSTTQSRNSGSSSVSESESEWRNKPIIIPNCLPAIVEGKELEMKFIDIGESEYEENVFEDDDMQSQSQTIKVNLAAIDAKWWNVYIHI